MAVMDQDNFSNISWHSEGPGGASTASAAAHDDSSSAAENAASGVESALPSDGQPNYNQLDAGGLGTEVLDCTVSSPLSENEGTNSQFVSYLVTTNTTFSTFQRSTVSVRRRFTDFLFLYAALCREHPECAVPPIPDKQRMARVTGDRFGSDFTNRRRFSLQRFLARCALHPILRRSHMLHTFLESGEWNATMRTQSTRASTASAADGSGGGGGVFDTFADSFINVFTKVHKPDRRFIEVRERSDRLDEDLGHVEKVVSRVARRETDIEADYRDLAEQFQKLITLEPGVEGAVHAFAASVEDTASGVRRLRDATDQDYLGSLRDMSAYSGALKNLLKAREQKQLDFEQLTEYLNKSTADRDMLASGYHGSSSGGPLSGPAGYLRSKVEDMRGVDHEQSRRERLRKLELRIEELTAEVERAKGTSELFDEEVVREVADFERIKRAEFKKQLGGFADSHIEFYGAVAEIWEKYVEEMEKEGVLAP